MANKVRQRSRPPNLEPALDAGRSSDKANASTDPATHPPKAPAATSDDDKKVGYGRPPKTKQFKPGQSGNPNGRPKGAKNLETLLELELEKKVKVKENGVIRTVSKRDLLVTQLVNKGAAGDNRAVQTIMKIMEPTQARAANKEEGYDQSGDGSLDADDKAILARYIADEIKHTTQPASEDTSSENTERDANDDDVEEESK